MPFPGIKRPLWLRSHFCLASNYLRPGWLIRVRFRSIRFELRSRARVPVVFSPCATIALRRSAFRSVYLLRDQNPKGEMVLNPPRPLIFYPALLALEPGDERRNTDRHQRSDGCVRKVVSDFCRRASAPRKLAIRWHSHPNQNGSSDLYSAVKTDRSGTSRSNGVSGL